MDKWEKYNYFPSSVYMLEKPEFLTVSKTVAFRYLENIKKEKTLDPLYPIWQTENFFHEPELQDFTSYIAQTSWNILSDQGFEMDDKETYFLEMWLHSYQKYGSMEQHIHPRGSQITGFYIIEAPENCSRIVIHDPRPGKIQNSFSETLGENVKDSMDTVYFIPKEGTLFFSNSWLPHSFTRNGSDLPFSFVHFSLGIREYYVPKAADEIV